jgi:hypothetical protein
MSVASKRLNGPVGAVGTAMATVLALAVVTRRQASTRPGLLRLSIKINPLQLSTAEIASECLK